jgi:integrase
VPIRANRAAALLSKMFSLAATRWEMRSDNPCRGLERNTEEKRNRYLAGDELRRLTEALAVHPNQAAANAIRLLLLTGARRGEVLGATWDQFDLEEGVWTKAASFTKQKKLHRVPLSAPARQLLAEIKAAAERKAEGANREHSAAILIALGVAIRFSRPAGRAEGRRPPGRDQVTMGRHLHGCAAQRRARARSAAFLRQHPRLRRA